ncbi:TetR family transcriptional regulator [Candidatus Cyanaurora vandensis]|uniref:TetR family transcriptional regulator n=1 Tax=Candidatus Cyanaurora vandensis TaxID=2714958 RepID=UPI00257CC3A7|nr:TetR family transcriptional regulator [Candidatus Cyanaurora vandensis]
MTPPPLSTRQRLLQAAWELFAAQGITETTTRQIAERAGVNEVTLFRQFGHKHRLLAAALEESAWLAPFATPSNTPRGLRDYASQQLQVLEQVPALLRSLIGEAGHYPIQTRLALGQALQQINRHTTQYLASANQKDELSSAQRTASLLNTLLLGYALVQFTSGEDVLWRDREDFLDSLVVLGPFTPSPMPEIVSDLSPNLVHELLQRAKKAHPRDYAWIYTLFATGLTPTELVQLQRDHQITDGDQYLLQIAQGVIRQVPVNQRILGKRYGSYSNNPLTQWLKSRKDRVPELFVDNQGVPLTLTALCTRWQELVTGLITPIPTIEQARQTWGVEMLLRGITPEDLTVLSGLTQLELQPYLKRVKEKQALEQALKLDH